MSEENKEPKPVFQLSENFSSAYFGKLPDNVTGEKNPAEDEKLISNFISLLTNPAQHHQKAEALAVLRNAKAQQFLVDLLAMKKYQKYRKELIMACWESGLDFSAHLIFFVDLVVNCEYPEAMEAITVIDEMHNLQDIQSVSLAISKLTDASLPPDKQSLASETVERLTAFTV